MFIVWLKIWKSKIKKKKNGDRQGVPVPILISPSSSHSRHRPLTPLTTPTAPPVPATEKEELHVPSVSGKHFGHAAGSSWAGRDSLELWDMITSFCVHVVGEAIGSLPCPQCTHLLLGTHSKKGTQRRWSIHIWNSYSIPHMPRWRNQCCRIPSLICSQNMLWPLSVDEKTYDISNCLPRKLPHTCWQGLCGQGMCLTPDELSPSTTLSSVSQHQVFLELNHQ